MIGEKEIKETSEARGKHLWLDWQRRKLEAGRAFFLFLFGGVERKGVGWKCKLTVVKCLGCRSVVRSESVRRTKKKRFINVKYDI